MAHSKTLQFYRNNTIVRPDANNNKTALTVAKETLTTSGSKQDGEITLVRYQEGNNDPVKTLAGLYYKNGNTGTWTYVTEFPADNYYTKDEIDDNELVVARALTELDNLIADVDESIPTTLAELTGDSTHRLVTDTEKSTWNAKADTVPIITSQATGDITPTLAPNTFYIFGSIDSLTISLTPGTGFFMYAGKFTASSNWGSPELSVPASVTEAASNDTVEAGNVYEFSILDNVIIVKNVS